MNEWMNTILLWFIIRKAIKKTFMCNGDQKNAMMQYDEEMRADKVLWTQTPVSLPNMLD